MRRCMDSCINIDIEESMVVARFCRSIIKYGVKTNVYFTKS